MERLEQYAGALEIPLYRLFYEGEEPPKKPNLPAAEKAEPPWGTRGKEWPELRSLAKALSRMDGRRRMLLLGLAQRIASLTVRSQSGSMDLPDTEYPACPENET